MTSILHDDKVRASALPDAGRPAEPGMGNVRVLYLCDHLGHPNGVIHGLTRYCLNVLPLLGAPPVTLTVCFFREAHAAGDRLAAAGIRPIFFGRHRWDPRALGDLQHLVRERRPDVIHAAGMKGILLARTAARRAGCGAVVHFHDRNPVPQAIRWMLRRTAPWSEHAIAVSRSIAEFAVREFQIPPQHVETLYNGLDLGDFAPAGPAVRASQRLALGVGPQQPVIGVVGRLSPEKGHVNLLGQLHRIRDQVPDTVLLLAGEGPLRRSLELQVRDLGLDGAVRFLGQRDDVNALLAAVDVVAVPSRIEGVPYTVLEAMAAARPLVVTRVGGIPEIVVDGESAIMVPAEDDRALADAIVEVLRTPPLAARLGESARVQAQRFSTEAHVRRLREIYLQLVARRRPDGVGESERRASVASRV